MVKNKFLKSIFLLCLTFCFSNVYSQSLKYYLVYLKDKNHSAYFLSQAQDFLSQKAINRRINQKRSLEENDLPVSQYYIDSIQSLGLNVWLKSKWLNAVVIYTDSVSIKKLNVCSFVLKSSPISRKKSSIDFQNLNSLNIIKSMDYGSSAVQTSMIGIDKMHANGFAGQGIEIAVLDGGFNNANNLSVFDSLYLNNRILGTYDYVKKETAVYEDHEHGMMVLSALAGYSEGNLIGGAYKSKFYLLRTEDVNIESPLEEVNWLVAAEFADSVGVDIITSSLGYTDFDNTSLSHTYKDMNGNTTIISKAAKLASRKGMIVCVSAGNDGANSWKYISSPADTDSIIAVGAVDNQSKYAYFSSRGPSADGRIKPDLSAKGLGAWVANTNGTFGANNGTSFASPVLCGLVAGYWSQFPNLTNYEVIENIKKSASQYYNPDNLLGYGIPDYTIARSIVLGLENEFDGNSFKVFPNPIDGNYLTIKMLDTSKINNYEIFKIDGSSVFVPEVELLSHQLVLDVKSLVQGVYLLKLTTENTSKTVKFLRD